MAPEWMREWARHGCGRDLEAREPGRQDREPAEPPDDDDRDDGRDREPDPEPDPVGPSDDEPEPDPDQPETDPEPIAPDLEPVDASGLDQFLLDLVNETRADAGADPLTLNADLSEAALGHTEWMLAEDVFDHTGEGGSSAGDRAEAAGWDGSGWGENIAWRTTDGLDESDVAALHEQLVNSPGHYQNIIGDFAELGVGLAEGDFDGRTAAMVTEVFGA